MLTLSLLFHLTPIFPHTGECAAPIHEHPKYFRLEDHRRHPLTHWRPSDDHQRARQDSRNRDDFDRVRFCRNALQRLNILHIMCLVLNAAAACPVFERRTARAHHLQPPPQLGFPPSQHSLAIASLQLWLRGNKQRAQLLCCSGALFDLVFRLARAANKQQSRFFEFPEFEGYCIAAIMRRCFSVYAWRLRIGLDLRKYKYVAN